MEANLKKGIKYLIYIVAASLGFFLIAFGFQHRAGKTVGVEDNFFATHVFADAPSGDSAGDTTIDGADSNDDAGADDDDDDDDDDG